MSLNLEDSGSADAPRSAVLTFAWGHISTTKIRLKWRNGINYFLSRTMRDDDREGLRRQKCSGNPELRFKPSGWQKEKLALLFASSKFRGEMTENVFKLVWLQSIKHNSKSNPIRFNPIQSDSIRSNPILSNVQIQYSHFYLTFQDESWHIDLQYERSGLTFQRHPV